MTELQFQAKAYQWCNNTYLGKCYIFAVPNGGTRNPMEAQSLKASGVRAGVADLILLLPGGRAVFIELKTDIGKQSEHQKGFEGIVNKLGFEYYLCRNLEEFKKLVSGFM